MEERPFEEDAELEDLGSPPEEVGEVPTTDPGAPAAGVPAEPSPSAIHRLQEQLDQTRDQHLRLAADFDNFRKRVARERLELSDRAQAALVVRLLEVLDDLDRIAATDPDTPVGAVRQGIEMVDKKLRKELEAGGLERVDPAGSPFDPAEAEAVAVLPPADPALDHHVAQTFQVGYRFKGTLVRPARVQVYSAEGQA